MLLKRCLKYQNREIHKGSTENTYICYAIVQTSWIFQILDFSLLCWIPWITRVETHIVVDSMRLDVHCVLLLSVDPNLVIGITTWWFPLSYLYLRWCIYRNRAACPAVVWISINVRANEEWFCIFISQTHMHPYCGNAWTWLPKIFPSGKVKNIVPTRGKFPCCECKRNTVLFSNC